jgi:hypothetical protein
MTTNQIINQLITTSPYNRKFQCNINMVILDPFTHSSFEIHFFCHIYSLVQLN